jgi:hypothetical protein
MKRVNGSHGMTQAFGLLIMNVLSIDRCLNTLITFLRYQINIYVLDSESHFSDI